MKIKVDAKFVVGEIVGWATEKAMFDSGKKMYRSKYTVSSQVREAIPAQILSVVIETCSAGTQVMYRVRITPEKLVEIHESELVRWEDVASSAVELSKVRKELDADRYMT